MESSLVASAATAGRLFSGSTFEVPAYQREYAWTVDEVQDFWEDLRASLEAPEYFLGLVILTEDDRRRQIVDGQQRLLSLTLLASALFHEANRHGRNALADRIQNTFLTSIDYETDEPVPRLILADSDDEATLREIVHTGRIPNQPTAKGSTTASEGISARIVDAYRNLSTWLTSDLRKDPFRRLGQWVKFLTERLFVAVFVHPDAASAYRVFEVVNTRGRDLTTADLLKNFAISQVSESQRDQRYREWQSFAKPLNQVGSSALVQFIRHTTTLHAGHVLPRDLFDFLASRSRQKGDKQPPTIDELMSELTVFLPLYLQMIDPTLEGPAQAEWLPIFDALNGLGVLSVRPLLMAISKAPDPSEGMEAVLRLVVRRIVVGNLGTGNVERRLAEAARETSATGDWHLPLHKLEDLNPSRDEFEARAGQRSFNKATLLFLRQSDVQSTWRPDNVAHLHLIRPRQASDWPSFPADEFTFWGSTLGNTILTKVERRPKGATSWEGVKENLIPQCLDEDSEQFGQKPKWSVVDVEERGVQIAQRLTSIWFGSSHE